MSLFSQTGDAITIHGPAGMLQAAGVDGRANGHLADRSRVAVVCHPHPQHGGTMNNKVVTSLVRTYRDLGVPSLRFNFRGVEKSEGEYGRAVGEVEDLLAVLDWLKERAGEADLLLAGFSFGSAIAAQVTHRSSWAVRQLTLVAPPVERYDFDRDGHFPCPVAVAQGGRDEIVMAEGVHDWCESRLQSACELLRYEDAGHFFHGRLTELKADLSAVIPRQLGVIS